MQFAILLSIFLAGVAFRLVILYIPHTECDERIYRALVEQLEAGKGYTLQGHPMLDHPSMVREQYDVPLFYHPPGGVVLFLIFHRLFGESGFGIVQLLSYGIFFWSEVLLARIVLVCWSNLQVVVLATLTAFTPIMTHVAARYWLDGPILAFSTASAAVFLLAIERQRTALALLSGILLGLASLIKLTSFLIVPGVGLLALATAPSNQFRPVIHREVVALAIAGMLQLPWEIYQWLVVGSPFPFVLVNLSDEAIVSNPFTYFVAVLRSRWIYVVLLPQVLWTIVPSLLLLVWGWPDKTVRRRGAALVGWILIVVATHIALAYAGFGPLARYTILVTPASVLLFTLVFTAALSTSRGHDPSPVGQRTSSSPMSILRYLLVMIAVVGFLLEIIQGVKTPLVDDRDMIYPLRFRSTESPPL